MEFQIDIMKCSSTNYYYVYLINEHNTTYVSDEDISFLLDMNLRDYQAFMLSHGAVYMGLELAFVVEQEAIDFIKLLNEKYLLLAKLMGEI